MDKIILSSNSDLISALSTHFNILTQFCSAKRLFKSHSFKIKVNKPANQLFSVVRICATPMAAENEEYNTDSVNQSVY